MKSISKLFALIFSVIFLTSSANSLELKFGHVGKPGSLFHESAEHFKDLANKRLGGKAKVVTFGSSQLGKDKQLLQKVKAGTVNYALPSSVMSSVNY